MCVASCFDLRKFLTEITIHSPEYTKNSVRLRRVYSLSHTHPENFKNCYELYIEYIENAKK